MPRNECQEMNAKKCMPRNECQEMHADVPYCSDASKHSYEI